jgi:hypothetical protein
MSIEGHLVLDNEHMRTSKTVDETASTQDSSATQGELPRFEPYESPAGGWGALQAVAKALRERRR